MSEPPNEYEKKIYNVDNWQSLHVQQLAYTRNLAIILASAALGYTLNKLDSYLPIVLRTLLIIVCFIQIISIVIGFIIAYRESKNYRLKYHISRNVLRNIPYADIEKQCTRLENGNRCLIIIQLVLLGIAVTSETILILIKQCF